MADDRIKKNIAADERNVLENELDGDDRDDGADTANPPRTTTGKVTAPKFGSAGSGGLELEPGPERP